VKLANAEAEQLKGGSAVAVSNTYYPPSTPEKGVDTEGLGGAWPEPEQGSEMGSDN